MSDKHANPPETFSAGLLEYPMIATAWVDVPPLHSTVSPWLRLTVVIASRFVQVAPLGIWMVYSNGPTSLPPAPETVYVPGSRKGVPGPNPSADQPPPVPSTPRYGLTFAVEFEYDTPCVP